jgi:hypothetical protein
MAAAMESPGAFPESPTEQEDVVYPCKGCGEVRRNKEWVRSFMLTSMSGIRFSKRARHSNLVSTTMIGHSTTTRLTHDQLETVGTLIASGAIPAAHSSIRTRTYSSLVTDRSSATTVHTAAMPVATKSRTSRFSRAIKLSAPAALGVATVRGRLRT